MRKNLKIDDVKLKLEDVLMPSGYAARTFINGNRAKCVEYLNDLIMQDALQALISENNILKQRLPVFWYEWVIKQLKSKDFQLLQKGIFIKEVKLPIKQNN